MSYDYKVVPFIGQSRGGLSAADVAKQLELTIAEHVERGWEFYQLSDVNIEVQPGCLAGLFGAKVQYVRFDQLIFRAHRDSSTPSHVRRSSQRTPTKGFGAAEQRDVADANSPGDTSSRASAIPVTSKHREMWLQKSDEEVREAAKSL